MGPSVLDRCVRPLTSELVVRMVEAGLLGEEDRLELLDGVLTEKPMRSPEHEEVKRRLALWIDPTGNRERFDVLIEGALDVAEPTALPEPDVLAVPTGRDPRVHPRTALLVVEVAVSSRALDLGRKAELYAGARVPEYWVVDVPEGRLVRFTGPADGGYARRESLVPPARLRPLALDVAPLDLAALLAGLEAA